MIVLLSIVFFIAGFFLREILLYIYDVNKKMKRADEILEEERKRKEFKKGYDFSDSFSDKDENANK